MFVPFSGPHIGLSSCCLCISSCGESTFAEKVNICFAIFGAQLKRGILTSSVGFAQPVAY